jgi:ABC-2 type transport system ATP-binding protein
VEVLGRDPRADVAASRLVGLVPQQESVLEVLTAFEFVRLAAVLNGVADPDAAAEQSLRVVELDPGDKRRLPAYSKGMKQRVKLAQALVHGPRVLVLDEPLTGLDPRQRLQMTEVIHRLGDEGRCVLVSSHVLEEVERFGSRVLVVAQGRMAAEGDFREIRALMDDRPMRVRLRAGQARRLVGGLIERGLVNGAHLDDEMTVVIDTADVAEFSRGVVTLARDTGATLYELTALDDDLESVFRYLVER